MLVIIPLVVIGVILKDILKKLITITNPLSSKMSFAGPLIESIVAGIIIVILIGAIFFLSGIFFKSYLGNSFEKWLEKKLLNRIPFYDTIRNITRQFTGVEKGKYAVVEVDLNGNKNRVLGLLTETLDDGRYVIYIPYAPFINIGQVHIIPKENVKKLDISLKDVAEIISQFGFEADKVYK